MHAYIVFFGQTLQLQIWYNSTPGQKSLSCSSVPTIKDLVNKGSSAKSKCACTLVLNGVQTAPQSTESNRAQEGIRTLEVCGMVTR